MRRKKLWLFLVKLVPISVALCYLWFARLQLKYPDLVEWLAGPVFRIFRVRTWWLNLLLEHFTSLVPYLALVLSTGGIFRGWKRTIGAIVGGFAIILLGHTLMSVAVYYIMDFYLESRTSYILIVPVYLINDALPLILWLLFYPGVLSELFNRSSDGSAQSRSEKGPFRA